MENKSSRVAKLTLPSENEILVTREFAAPKALVFDAWSKPEHVRAWYACSTLEMPVCEIDFKVGGKWRFVLKELDGGRVHPMSGEYTEIARPDRISFTEVYEPIAGTDHLVTLTFDERDGVTTFRQRYVHTSNENRDAHLKSGMENGLDEIFGRMEEVIASMVRSKRASHAEHAR
jgi:uncharacterized protein YndB with AHSA1/START domain